MMDVPLPGLMTGVYHILRQDHGLIFHQLLILDDVSGSSKQFNAGASSLLPV
jgi:hypothetical protein